jgi:uncharacterized membrane protein
MNIQPLRVGMSALFALLMAMLLHGTALAQTYQTGTEEGTPPVIFMVVVAGVFVGITVLFVVFARSQGCDTSNDQNETWN